MNQEEFYVIASIGMAVGACLLYLVVDSAYNIVNQLENLNKELKYQRENKLEKKVDNKKG